MTYDECLNARILSPRHYNLGLILAMTYEVMQSYKFRYFINTGLSNFNPNLENLSALLVFSLLYLAPEVFNQPTKRLQSKNI